MILRWWLISIFVYLTSGGTLKCSSYLESHKNTSIRDIRLAESRTLCLRPRSDPSKIYAISVLEIRTQWAITSKQDFVLADFRAKQCYCDCRRESSICERKKLRKECPDCIPLIQSHRIGSGCDSNTEATSCCNIEMFNASNISTLHLSHPSLFYRLEVSVWNETIDRKRSLQTTKIHELHTEERYRLTVDEILFEFHAAQKHAHPMEREVIIDDRTNKIIPLLHSHRCIDAFKYSNGSLQVREAACLPAFELDDCSHQRLIVEEGKPHFIDFSHGHPAHFSQDRRHLSMAAQLMLTMTIDDQKNALSPVEDDAKIDDLKDVRIEVDDHSHRRFHAILHGAQGTLHFTFITQSSGARYSIQYHVPSSIRSDSHEPYHKIALALPESIREAATVCVSPLDKNETSQLCVHAPYEVMKIKTKEFFKSSIFKGSCEGCIGATSFIERITAAVSLFIPAKSLSRLFHGESLEWSDAQVFQ
ncbi:unnamed protein product, partial [Mesorhabditis belari]|uniref:Uncharacterized protein n=1 Tax=Mesorhabditis belari TaxID=2138241 RepID=A0AAF3EX04_9BILA